MFDDEVISLSKLQMARQKVKQVPSAYIQLLLNFSPLRLPVSPPRSVGTAKDQSTQNINAISEMFQKRQPSTMHYTSTTLPPRATLLLAYSVTK